MKIFFTYIVAFAYLFLSTGFTVSKHFCMGEMDSITIGAQTSDECNKCGMHSDESKGCCHDDVSVYKISDDQQQHQLHDFSATKFFADITTPFNFENHEQCIASALSPIYQAAYSPPLIKDRCVLHQAFLI